METSLANTRSQAIHTSLRVSTAAVFFASLALVMGLKFGGWTEIPYWDAAMGVFPASLTLAETDFDYPSLLEAPTFFEGGPNVHATSLITLVYAVIIKLSPTHTGAYFIIHLTNYILSAGIVALLYAWSWPLLGRAGAILSAFTALLFPVVFTQAGQMYLEIPCLFAATAAMMCFKGRQIIQATVWSAVAVAIKQPGIVVAGTLSLLTLFDYGPLSRRLLRGAAIAAPSLIVLFGFVGSHAAAGDRYTYIEFLRHVWFYIKAVPDLLILICATPLFIALMSPRVWRPSTTPDAASKSQRIFSYVFMLMFLAFYLLVPLVGTIHMLPRYYVLIIPLMILNVADSAKALLGQKAMMTLLSVCLVFSLLNYNGRLYPRIPGNNGAIAERSAEYSDLLKAQRDILAAAEQLPPEVPVFYGLPEHYFSNYPAMGYVERSIANGRCFTYERKYAVLDINEFPNHFFLLLTSGPNLNWVKTQADNDPSRYSVNIWTFPQGNFQTRLIEIRRLIPTAPSPQGAS
ncbi:MAG: hypothetical protein WD768_12195 [Phycisphaeraceae bacterium]